MATHQKGKCPGVIESVSRFAGTLAGCAVGAGKWIVDSVTLTSKDQSDTPGEKTTQTPAKKAKKAARKTGTKTPKAKIKKVAKRKAAGAAGKSATSGKKSASSPSKKKKATASRKKAASRQTTKKTTKKTAKGEASHGSQASKSPKVGANMNVSAGNRDSTIASSEAELRTCITARSPERSTPVVELGSQRRNTTVPTISGSLA